jgi:hypothetical protein
MIEFVAGLLLGWLLGSRRSVTPRRRSPQVLPDAKLDCWNPPKHSLGGVHDPHCYQDSGWFKSEADRQGAITRLRIRAR